MKATCTVCNETFERGVGQSRSKYCSTECRKESRKSRTKPTNGKSKAPQPYQKKDGNWYCTYQGRQHYLGNDLFKAQKKLEEILNGNHVPGGHDPRPRWDGRLCRGLTAPLENPRERGLGAQGKVS